MADSWNILADYLASEMAKRGWYQHDLAESAGVSLRTISRLLNSGFRRLPRTIASIEHAVGWPPGTARRIVYEGYRPDEQPRREPHPDPWIESILLAAEPVATPEQLDEMASNLERGIRSPEGVRRSLEHLARVMPQDEWEDLVRRRTEQQEREAARRDDERSNRPAR